MDKSTQAKREKQAQERLQKAVLSVASIAGMSAEDFKALETQVRPSLRNLFQLETLTGILEGAAGLLESESENPKTKTKPKTFEVQEAPVEAPVIEAKAPAKAPAKKAKPKVA